MKRRNSIDYSFQKLIQILADPELPPVGRVCVCVQEIHRKKSLFSYISRRLLKRRKCIKRFCMANCLQVIDLRHAKKWLLPICLCCVLCVFVCVCKWKLYWRGEVRIEGRSYTFWLVLHSARNNNWRIHGKKCLKILLNHSSFS